jgi:hypothetical protein
MTIGVPAFWDTVKDCLVEIYHLPADEAATRVERLFRGTLRLEEGLQSSERWLGELVYHHEPINLAGELAQLPVPNTPESNSLYHKIVERHAATVVSEAETVDDPFDEPYFVREELKPSSSGVVQKDTSGSCQR